MKRIDLIIDALEQTDRMRRKQGYTEEYLQEALDAARELRDMKPVGEIRTIIWGGMAWSVGFISHEKLNLRTKLYALDEVTK